MPRSLEISGKRLMISKANTTIVIAVAVAASVTTFSLVATRSLLAKRAYQSKVSSAREKARDQLKDNIDSVNKIKESYAAFTDEPVNMIKGSSAGQGERDGDNAQIILDALPSTYDFPALASSLEKILVDRNYTIESITGTDDEVNQNNKPEEDADAAQAAQAAPTPGSTNEIPDISTIQGGQTAQKDIGNAVEMAFGIKATGSYQNMLNVLDVFSHSIRVLSVSSLTFEAQTDNLIALTIQGKSYYLPGKALNIKEEVVQ